MNSCLQVQDKYLIELGDSAVAEYEQRIANIPPDLSSPFNVAAMRLQDELVCLYKLVALCARSEQNLDKVASLWEFMEGTCDRFAQELSKLHLEHPVCGADLYYNQILDLRNKCHRLREMHL
ncbi:MAG TPA: hypothetical protein VH595_00915 [Verrucomicrobiae bacterium]|jgi:hypothetical protein|nr:hypothetical protein [Verrucomicrobiae bacterium]